ncbi:MAG TPA: NPCBM/NEW2 domain-containing protein, partial [Pirellulaceae bacterium]
MKSIKSPSTASAIVAGIVVSCSSAFGADERQVYQSPLVDESIPGHAVGIDCDVSGAKKLFLVVTDGGDGFACDWADWAEPRLIVDGKETKLTDLNWKSASGEWGKVSVNKNADGKPLRIGGKDVEYGIGTHANSIIEYDLPAGATRFLARGGIDNGGSDQGGSSSMKFYVYREKPDLAN